MGGGGEWGRHSPNTGVLVGYRVVKFQGTGIEPFNANKKGEPCRLAKVPALKKGV